MSGPNGPRLFAILPVSSRFLRHGAPNRESVNSVLCGLTPNRKGSRVVAQRLPTPRRPAWSACVLSELLVEILDDLPDSGPLLIQMRGEPPGTSGTLAKNRT